MVGELADELNTDDVDRNGTFAVHDLAGCIACLGNFFGGVAVLKNCEARRLDKDADFLGHVALEHALGTHLRTRIRRRDMQTKEERINHMNVGIVYLEVAEMFNT